MYVDELDGVIYSGNMDFKLKSVYPNNVSLFDPRAFCGRGMVLVNGHIRKGYFRYNKRFEETDQGYLVYEFASECVEYAG